MASLAKFHYSNQPFHIKLNDVQITFQPKPTSSYRILQKPPKPSRAIRASPSSSSSTPKPSLLKTTCVTLTTAAALLSASLHLSAKPAVAAAPPIAPTSLQQSIETDQEAAAALEKHLAANPNDIESLKSLMKIKLQSKNLDQSLQILNRLISLDPEELEWRVLKAQVQTYGGDLDSAAKGFEEILARDPLRVEAYHGLVMAYSESESKFSELEGRIGGAIERCRKEDRKKEFRDLMLLIAQIRVMEGNPSEALRVYEELVKDEPRDFRPYLCQGLIYTLLKRKDEAEKQFEQFRNLVPDNHPYKHYFDSNMLNTNKLFAMS